jgi:hypothetical protein
MRKKTKGACSSPISMETTYIEATYATQLHRFANYKVFYGTGGQKNMTCFDVSEFEEN